MHVHGGEAQRRGAEDRREVEKRRRGEAKKRREIGEAERRGEEEERRRGEEKWIGREEARRSPRWRVGQPASPGQAPCTGCYSTARRGRSARSAPPPPNTGANPHHVASAPGVRSAAAKSSTLVHYRLQVPGRGVCVTHLLLTRELEHGATIK